MTAPVTCVITTFNSGEYLSGTLRSVLLQSCPVAEVIVADDCSTDGTRAEIERLAAHHAEVAPLLREQNVGVAANRDLGIRAAQHPFITHLDGDDFFAPNKIAAEWSALEGSKEAVAFSRTGRIHPGSALRSKVVDPAPHLRTPKQALLSILGRRGPIPRDMLLSLELYQRAGGLTHGVPLYEDWQYKLRLAALLPQWRESGAVGTLYMLRDNGSLSSAPREKRRLWERRVIKDILAFLVEAVGNERAVFEVLSESIGIEGVKELCSELPVDFTGHARRRPTTLTVAIEHLRALNNNRMIKALIKDP